MKNRFLKITPLVFILFSLQHLLALPEALNQDGLFDEAAETFISLIAPKPVDCPPFNNVTSTAFVLGGFTQDFTTRMRVAMKRGSYPTPCEHFAFGEVEDYTIHVAPGGGHSQKNG